MIRSTTLLFLLAIIPGTWLIGPPAFSQDKALRQWWSHDGNESIQASLESFDKKTRLVSLKDRQGEIIEVKISLLSRADRRFVARSRKTEPSVVKVSDDIDDANEKVEPKRETVKRKEKKPANVVSQPANVVSRYGINWTEGVEKALASANSKEQRRPVMLFRVLGDLDSFM